MQFIISGIQQIGIGIPDVKQAWKWYRQQFGIDVPIFEEAAEANLMLPYTGGKPHQRHAVLAISLQGGSGMEIWQYTSRTPQPPAQPPMLGDYGIFAARIKSRDVAAAHRAFASRGLALHAGLRKDPAGQPVCWVKDPYGNHFQIVPDTHWFSRTRALTGGIAGCMIGVSDIEAARQLYSGILGYDDVVYDREGVWEDLAGLPGGEFPLRRVLLGHRQARQGAFSRIIGPSRIELVQLRSGRSAVPMFKGRFWGDLGFIHLCFDVIGMDDLRQQCAAQGFPFTVDSGLALGKAFDMGEASGLFSYIEDPDGTLIEFVETLKMPIAKKWGWYLDLRKRDARRPLPDWMLKALSLNRVRD
ncbi:MAG: VOC family protein [Bacteroidia bacterium]|nr:VOC family protein [Bacteroidia bacterium]